MSAKRKIWLLSLVYLFISITVGFLNKANSQQLADQPLDWMSQVKTAISSTSLQKIPATVRSLINAPAEYLEMNSRFMQITKIGTDQPEIALLVKFNGNIKSLESAGAKIGSKIGDIYTVNIPINRLGDLAALKNVVCIEPSMKAYPTLDNSIIENKANLVHQGNYGTTPPVYSGYTGKDVIVGAIDSGIDWEHEDFIDDNNNTSRILYIWDQTLTPQNGEYNPSGFTYGVEYTQTQLNNEIDGSPAGFVRTEDTDGHGTHVTGIIAGDGSSTGGGIPNYTYVGMAPQADILFVKTGFYFNEIIDGIHYAMQKADILGKPLVINLSLGSQYGAHDGTSLFDQTIDNAVNTGKVTIVVSAGNVGTDVAHGSYIHAEGNVTTDSTSTMTFSVPSYSANSSGGNDLIFIDMWYQGGDDINVKINTPNGYTWDANTGSDNNNNALNSLDGAIYIDNAVNGLDTNNFDRECYIQIWDYYSYRTPESGTWTITITGNNITESGHFDSWIYTSQLGNENSYFTSSSGSNREVIGSPSAAEQAITVAAHTVTNSWVDYWGSSHTYTDAVLNDLAFFSSAGPTRDDPGYLTGRQKPDICASGFGVISARSSDATGTSSSTSRNEDGEHLMMSGTSMSSPMVAGAVALMMDKDPTLSGQQIKTYLGNSAISDAFTGSVPNNLWGYGKLDIYETMQQFDPPEYAPKITPTSLNQKKAAGDTATYVLTIKNIGSQSDSYDLTVSGNTWPTSIWDNTGTTEIISTGTISPDVEFIIIVKVQIPAESVPDDNDEAIVRATSNGNFEVYAESIINTGVAHPSGTLPWSEDFSSLTLDDIKWTSNTGPAEINDNGANEPSSPYSLNLNGNSTGGDDIQSQFIDLSGKENVILSYYYQRTGYGDSPETDDDLWVDYYSPSENWINLCQYLGSGSDMSSYTREDIALPPNAMHNQFRIRFHNSGTSGEYDDWFIDDVSLNIVSPPDITVTPSGIDESLDAGDSTVNILKIENTGSGDLNYNISIEYNNPVSAIDYLKLSGNTHKINEQISRSEYSTASLSLNENNKLTSSTGSLQIHKQNAIKENELDMISYHPAKINNKIKNVKNGNTIYVDVNNTSGIEDGTPEHPYRLIQTGINNASNGYVIIVRQGIYNENNISVNKSVTLQGNGAIINGNEIGDMIKGFMLHQGVQGAIINNFIITNCYWPIFVYGTSGGGNQIINNTLAYNAGTGIPIFNDCIIMNNIVAFNGGFGLSYSGGVLQNSYNDVYGNSLPDWDDCSAGTGSFSDDPLFVNQAGNDFHLQSGSPCINAGNPSSIYNDSDGSRNDMGAFGGPYIVGDDKEWLSVTPLSGSISPDGSQNLMVELNAINLTTGHTYNANIIISSNDPVDPVITIPVELSVISSSTSPEIVNLYDFSITNYESYIINLDTCVIDNDDDVSTMTWEVTTTSPKIDIFLGNRTVFISCNDHGWNGAADITFKVTDPQLEYDENTVECTVNIPTSIDDLLDYIPNGFCLEQNYPNPGYPRTTIIYGMPKAADVSVSIYDLNGLLLLELVNGKEPSGYHSVIWETYDWPEGTYIIKMVAVDFVQTRKCLLIK